MQQRRCNQPRSSPSRIDAHPGWHLHSLGYPAIWLILSSVKLPASTVVAFQTKFVLKNTRTRFVTRSPRLPTYESVLHSEGWSPPTTPTSASGEHIPAPLLHLFGYGPEYTTSYCQQCISENLAAARVNNIFSREHDDETSPHNDTLVPTLRFRGLRVNNEAVSFVLPRPQLRQIGPSLPASPHL